MDSSVLLWMREALGDVDSRSRSSWDSSSLDGGEVFHTTEKDDLRNNPDFQRLVRLILWIRWFAKTYNFVLLAILFVISVVHLASKLRIRLHKNRSTQATLSRSKDVDIKSSWVDDSRSTRFREHPIATSSSDSSLSDPSEGLSRKQSLPLDERVPLLGRKGNPPSRSKLLVNRLQGWIMYQPRPIPVINKVLPDNGTSLVVTLFIGLNIFYWLYGLPWNHWFIFLLGDRAGLMFTVNLPLLYLLAAKNQPIRKLTGYSYEALNIFHRRLGEMMCFFALIHFLGMMVIWYTRFRVEGRSLIEFLTHPFILLGLGAFISYEFLYFTSLSSFRSRWYELFLALHILLQTAGLSFLFFHDPRGRVYILVSAGIFLIDRIVFRLFVNSTTFPATLTVLEDGETVLLSANWSLQRQSRLQRFLDPSIKHGWQANDHIFITVPSLARFHTLQAHPFTIASAAPDQLPGHAWLSLLIRAYDGFTRSLLDHALKHPNTPVNVRADGPYSSTHAQDLVESSEVILAVAGGSGIAVAFPLVWSLLHNTRSIEDEETLGNRARFRQVHLVWIVRSRSHLSWIPKDRLAELQEIGLHLRIEPPTSEAGRPDIREMVKKVVENSGSSTKVGMVVSGPDPMVRDVRNACASCVSHGKNVGIAVEKFGW